MNPLEKLYTEQGHNGGIVFDPRTKATLLVLLDIAVFLGRSLPYEAAVFLVCVLIVAVGGMASTALRYCAVFSLLVAVQQLIGPMVGQSAVLSLVQFLAVAVRKVLPCLLVAYWAVGTTGVSEFAAALWGSGMPKSAIITTSVAFRCFPTISEEWRAIRSAMKMRGIGTGLSSWLFHPIQTIAHIYVPLFASVISISDELAAAALCRGMDDPAPHTCLAQIGLRTQDWLALALVAAGTAAAAAFAIAGKGL